MYSRNLNIRVTAFRNAIPVLAVALLSACLPCSCAPSTDLSPAVMVGGEKISRACLDAAHRKSADGTSKEETLRALVRQALLARKAVDEGLHLTPRYRLLSWREIAGAQREFLCGELAVPGDCAAGLYAILEKNSGITTGTIDWGRLFPTPRRAPIALGGTIPADKTRASLPGVDWAYADTIILGTGTGAPTVTRLLKAAPAGETAALLAAGTDDRERIFRETVVALLSGDLARLISTSRRELLVEIEKRADEHVLAMLYREMLGLTPSPDGAPPRVLRPSEEEAAEYFEKNRESFTEPLWADLSHIRTGDYDSALVIYGKLKDSPGAFCDLARKHSISADKNRCGRLGIIRMRKGLPLHLELAFTLTKEGEIGEPVKAGNAYEILKLNARGVRSLAYGDAHTRRLIAEKLQPLLRKKALDAALREMELKYPVFQQR